MPGAAALIAGDDTPPRTGAVHASEPAAAAGMGGPDRDLDRDGTAALDLAGDPAAASGRHSAARDSEGDAVARAAIAAGGGEGNVPDAVIAADASIGSRRTRSHGEHGQQRQAARTSNIRQGRQRLGKRGHFNPAPGDTART